MVILGIHDGHNSGCSVFVDGKNKCTLSEEKITRKKNEYGFPFFSVSEALKFCKLNKNQIDFVAVSTKFLPPKYFFVKRNTSFTINEYLKEQNEYWYPKLYRNKKIKYLNVFKDKILKKIYTIKSI